MTGLHLYPEHGLDKVPPCRPDLFAFGSHARYVAWLQRWFPTAKVVDIHFSKSAPMPIVRVSGGVLGCNFFYYLLCLPGDAWRRAQAHPHVQQRLKRIRRRHARRYGRGSTARRCSRPTAGDTAMRDSSFTWEADAGEVLVQCEAGVIEALVEIGVLS